MKKAPPPPLFKHQTTSIRFMHKQDRILDFSDPGTGKTRVQIELFAARRMHGVGCALVIAPKSLLQSAWQDDFTKFAPNMKTVVATATNRQKAFEQTADVYITNTDAANWLGKQPPKFFKKFDCLIIDEMSSFKHHTSQRSKSLNKIKKHFKYRCGLTGTPSSNTITDLWHQVYLIDDGQRLGASFYQFRNSVCQPRQVGPQPNMLQWDDRPGAENAVSALLADITVRHKFEECLDIPENFTYKVDYHLSSKQMKAYLEMEKQAITMLEGGQVISTVNAAGVLTKLLQIASGAAYTEFGTGHTPLQKAAANALGYSLIDTDRYELISDLVQQRDHCVVFFNWNHQRDQIIAEFDKRGITYALIDGSVKDKDRKEAVDRFQAGFYKVLLAHPQSAAHGLTLTKATSTIWASPTYNLEHFIQGNRRTYRAGQTKKTETVVVVAPGTIEEKVMQKLQDKETRQTSMLNLLNDFFSGK